MILSIAIFIIVLAVLVLAHELGHFLAARKNGVRVDEFGFGFPPRIFGFKKGGTLYSFNLFPIGGFVRIFGEDDSGVSDPESFASKRIWQRAVILLGGVFFNILLAYFIFSFLAASGVPADADDPSWKGRVQNAELTATEIIAGSAAEKAGLKPGDIILSFQDETGAIITPLSVFDIQKFTQDHAGQKVKIEVGRKSQNLVLDASLAVESDSGVYLGMSSAKIGVFRAPWYLAPFIGLGMTADSIIQTVYGFIFIFKLLFSGHSVAGFISGPVGIFSVVAGSVNFGWAFLATLTAAISINLAVINLIPFPALDGGRLLFLAVEALRGKPISKKAGGLAHAVGFAILIMLMAAVTYLDFKTRL